MKKLFTFLSRANNNSVGISFNHRRVSFIYSMLTLVAILLMVPSGVKADIVTTTYNFKASIDANEREVTYSSPDETYTYCTYFSKIGNVADPDRFATQAVNSMYLGLSSYQYGLYMQVNGQRTFLVSKLSKGDVVEFNTVDNQGNANTVIAQSTNATQSNNSFTMKEKGVLAVKLPSYTSIVSITVKHDDGAAYAFDPAVEIYNLSSASGTLGTTAADFELNGNTANYLTISNYSLNNRIAVSANSNWSLDGGLKNNTGGDVYNLSITNLKADDRVKITYQNGNGNYGGNQLNFGSDATNGSTLLNSEAFKDNNNNGELDTDENEHMIARDEAVDGSVFYTMTHDGHLDLVVFPGVKITKIEIYGDHEAMMVDKLNEDADGYTAFFTSTGQLLAKEHIIPGGLEVHIGNEEESQHAIVIMSNEGPVSYVYDDLHYLMARNENKTYGYNDAVPMSGTYYKFIPEVNGTMTVRLKATTVHYSNLYDSSTMEIVSGQCPYYLMVQSSNSFYSENHQNKNNGETITFTKYVQKGSIYYIYGWWDSNKTNCGVAELIDVTFAPDGFVYPLAKCVDNGTTHVELASINKKTKYCVKKKSANIESCTLSTTGNGNKLTLVADITYKEGADKGGVVLVKIGSPSNEDDPVFALTIAYSAGYNTNTTTGNSEGHTWDFSSNPLNGLKWNNTNAEADVTPYGTYYKDYFGNEVDNQGNLIENNGQNGTTTSLLWEEMHEAGPNGTVHSDWLFNYRVSKGDTKHDPRFLNKYDMVGDNADMMWETEGLWFNTASNQSCIFNEKIGSIDRTDKDQKDPDRYVGILPGGEFTIPFLKKDDRVIIYMGSGDGSGINTCFFNITNARDAVYKEIISNDEYQAGGSIWNVDGNKHHDPYYRGCYHFYALDDGDMVFKMVGGSMCKLYEIQIYRGERRTTNGIEEQTGGYTLLSTKGQGGETKSWSLHYRGKGETLADGNGRYSQENEVIAQTGKITNTEIATDGNYINYTNNEGDLGTIRVRAKCMEYNHNYVTDYADRNLTLAYHETMSYPYTWDFMDMAKYSGDNIDAEWDNNKDVCDGIKTNKPYESYTCYNLSMWDEDGKMRVNSQEPDNDPHNYNYVFQNLKGDNGNQLWANDDVLPETQGLWFYMDNNDPLYSGCMQIDADGMHLINNASIGGRGWWNYKMVVPSVPAGAAVYLRMARDERVPEFDETDELGDNNIANSYSYDYDKQTQQWNKNPYKNQKYQFGHMSAKAEIEDGTNCRLFQAEDESGDYIVAIKNTGETSNLTFTLNGWTLKKLAISTDKKKLGSLGWATESRERIIDPSLTKYLSGKNIETIIATGSDYASRTVTLVRMNLEEEGDLMPLATNGSKYACILHNATEDKPIMVLDGGFHLFVPDMHDYDVTTPDNSQKTLTLAESSIMKAQLESGQVKWSDDNGATKNFVLTSSYQKVDKDDNVIIENQSAKEEGFYRVGKNNPINSSGHQGYLPVATSTASTHAKFSIVFIDDIFTQNQGIATEIDNASQLIDNDADWYNMNGQKLNGKPSERGIYIVNGKKVLVK